MVISLPYPYDIPRLFKSIGVDRQAARASSKLTGAGFVVFFGFGGKEKYTYHIYPNQDRPSESVILLEVVFQALGMVISSKNLHVDDIPLTGSSSDMPQAVVEIGTNGSG